MDKHILEGIRTVKYVEKEYSFLLIIVEDQLLIQVRSYNKYLEDDPFYIIAIVYMFSNWNMEHYLHYQYENIVLKVD